MTSKSYLFDACSILTLIRQLRGDAAENLAQGTTVALAYYELGNALWREGFLLKRISLEEADRLLKTIYTIVSEMGAFQLCSEAEAGSVLALACKFNITFYDATYLVEAVKTKRTLVTDDKKMAKAAQNTGTKTLTSNAFIQQAS